MAIPSTNAANAIADGSLANLRRALAGLPKSKRRDLTRLSILVLMIDLPTDDRAHIHEMFSKLYFPAARR